MATWNKLNIDAATLASNSTSTANKSLFIGQRSGNAIAAIYAGNDPSILDDPITNASKIFFHSNNDYLRIKSIVSVTLTLPARSVRTNAGGKKSGGGKISYNGYADYYIHKHDYGNPPPAFTVHITEDVSNGALANHGLTGTIPLQFMNGDSFRLGLCYSTDTYLCIRERYQVYSTDIPALTLKLNIYYYENPSSVYTQDSYSVVHTPLLMDAYNLTNGTYRTITQTTTFNTVFAGQTFNQVKITRQMGNGIVTLITALNGVAVTPFDPGTSTPYVHNLPSQSSTYSITVTTTITSDGYKTYNMAYSLDFVNTVTNKSVLDYIGGVHTFGDLLSQTGLPGLAGQYFSGDWRSTISTGNIGTLPLSAPTRYTSINYGSRGDYYGFIAIGYFMPPVTGTYTFYTSSDDGSGVWIGAAALPGATRTATNATLNNGLGVGQGNTRRSGSKALTAGLWYPIRIVHEEGNGGDNLTFSWSGPGIAETTDLSVYYKTPVQNGTTTMLGNYLP